MRFSLWIFTIMGLSLIATAGTAEEYQTVSETQFCTAPADCTLVEAGCERGCDFLPIHHDYAAGARKGRAAICGRHAENLPACRDRPSLAAACIDNRCTITRARQEYSKWKDYKRPGDDGWNWDGQQDGWDQHGFTAYDLPQEIVKMGRLELRKR